MSIGSDPVAAREATTSWIPDQKVPYSITYTGSIQRQFHKDWSLELRYLGTRGVHLLTQNRINRQNRITDTDFVPTFLSAPSPAVLASLPSWQTIRSRNPSFVPKFANAGFDVNSLVAFLPNGNSTYHAASAQLTRRFTRGFQMTAAYTWSHLIDDTTAEVFSTILSPRRVEDFQNLRRERADSALDRRHRFVLSSLYELPYFNKSSNKWARILLGGFNFAGTLTFESGEKAVVRSGIDSNQNGDSAGDRTIINVNGTHNTFSMVCAINNTGACIHVDPSTGELVAVGGVITNSPSTASARSATVGYLALNPNAQYIQAGLGAQTNAGRTHFSCPASEIWISQSSRISTSGRTRRSSSGLICSMHSIIRSGSRVRSTAERRLVLRLDLRPTSTTFRLMEVSRIQRFREYSISLIRFTPATRA